ncbi:MAG: phosphoenolpyruvate carboxykinase (ATP) [bacterium]|nr:phosphoenolpyruvate carboxykinase (ATP) [bacterium]
MLTVRNGDSKTTTRADLEQLGLRGLGAVAVNRPAAALYEEALRRGEGKAAAGGPLVVLTGRHTGRSAQDKFFVKEPSSEAHIDWEANKPISAEVFDRLYARVCEYLRGQDLFVLDCFAGADPAYRMPVRIVTQYAWHSLFARNLFIDDDTALDETPEFTVLAVPRFEADPKRDGTRSETFIIVNFAKRIVLIGGTEYAGEIKKSVFTIMNYLLPLRGVLSMHCSGNIGTAGDSAVFFGLSGTGKTTLSADPERELIGDDETGWSDRGVFNFEGGCYAKVIRLSKSAEPEIFAASHSFGSVLENVLMDDETRLLDLNSDKYTENTRSAYPLSYVPHLAPGSVGGHPKNVILLTADAFGVLPPIARLSRAQAMYHFLSGFTSKLAGTEKGLGKEPEATFSTCFGAPFMVHHPTVYSKLLGKKIAEHGAECWLINTGWNGGPYGIGKRMDLAYTRAMVRAALDGTLAKTDYETEPFFGLAIPKAVPGVPSGLLNPKATWGDKDAYDAQARRLARLFVENFRRFESHAEPETLRVAIKA